MNTPVESVAPAPRYTNACIALGSNLGDRRAHISRGFIELASLPLSRFVLRSRVVETAPVGPPGQSPYLNAVAIIETRLTPRALLDALLDIERIEGRVRSDDARWGPRTLDLDLLLFGASIVAEPGLTIPHPSMHDRSFVLGPLVEIAPHAIHPVLGATVEQLLARLPDAP